VLATVVPPGIRRAHPHATLHVLAPESIADVWKHSPESDAVVPLVKGGEVDAYRRGRYDLVLLGPASFGSAWRAFRGDVRSRRFGLDASWRRGLLAGALPAREFRRDRHHVENYRALTSLIGRPEAADVPRVVLAAEWRDEARQLWEDRPRPRVVLQPGATYGPAKRWRAERFAELARSLAGEGMSIAVVGGPGDRDAVHEVVRRAGVLDLGGRTGVGVLGAVRAADDGHERHGPCLAAAVGTPTVAIFSSTNPTDRTVRADHGSSRTVPCSPCYRRDCRIGYLCLGHPLGRVLAAVRSVLDATRRAVMLPGDRLARLLDAFAGPAVLVIGTSSLTVHLRRNGARGERPC
jgi:heptosyltransferase-2